MTRTDELVDALVEAMGTPTTTPDGFFTVRELARESGRREERVRRALQVLADEGRLEVQRVRRHALDGRLGVVPAYRVRPAPKKSAKR